MFSPTAGFALPRPHVSDHLRIVRAIVQIDTWAVMSLPSTPRWPADGAGVPKVDGNESFGVLVDKLSQCVTVIRTVASTH
jgi:hypothetical protein